MRPSLSMSKLLGSIMATALLLPYHAIPCSASPDNADIMICLAEYGQYLPKQGCRIAFSRMRSSGISRYRHPSQNGGPGAAIVDLDVPVVYTDNDGEFPLACSLARLPSW